MRDNLPLLDENGRTNPQLMAYSRLFQSEIGEFVNRHKSMHLQYRTSLDEIEETVKKYFDWFVMEILSNETTFGILHEEIKNKDPKLFNDLHMGKAMDDSVVTAYKEYFLRPSPSSSPDDDEYSDDELIDNGITVVDRLAECYHPIPSLEYLTAPIRYPTLANISDPVVHPKHTTEFNYRPYARAILRALPNLKREAHEIEGYPSLIYHFAKSCRNCSFNVPALMYFLPEYVSRMAEREQIVRSLTNTDRTTMKEIEVITKFRDPEMFKQFRKNEYDEDIVLKMDTDIHELREYQKELIQDADEGENTVIVAPTGSGKTLVAAYIIRNHIEMRREMGKGARVIIVAPTVPLVEQHGKVLYQYLGDVAYIDYLHGTLQLDQSDRIETILSKNVVICTPQLLINCFQSVRSEDRLFVSDFSLLILDECHHTCENHPYAQLMNLVRMAKGDVPQVVGMTASLGIGKKGLADVDNGVHHVKSLLARMGALSISRVVKHNEELAMRVPRPFDRIGEISRTPLREAPFTQQIMNYIKDIRTHLIASLESHTKFDPGLCIPKSLVTSLGQTSYGSNARFKGLLNDIKQHLSNMRGVSKVQLIDAINMILAFIKLLDMNDLLPASKALTHMREELKLIKSNEFHSEFYINQHQELKKLEGTEEDKRMLRKLREEVLSMDDSSQCIVFVETREVCKYLSDHIQSFLPKGKKCGFVMSSQSTGNSLIRQTHSEQEHTLRDFREGRISVMVATTVASEGIDIPQCNLIIKYNTTGDAISKVQQEGRARAKGSKSVLIVLDASVLQRERENIAAQARMKNILDGIHKQGKNSLKRDVEEIMHKMVEEVKEEEKKAKQLEEDMAMNLFDIQCGKCFESICPSHSIKVDPFSNTYYSTDTNIWDRIRVLIPVKISRQCPNSASVKVASIACGNCERKGHEHVIGKLYRHSSCYLPSLRLNTLRFLNSETGELDDECKRGWNGVHGTKFYISKIRDCEKVAILNALQQKYQQLYCQLEVRCAEIERRLRIAREIERRKKEEEKRKLRERIQYDAWE